MCEIAFGLLLFAIDLATFIVGLVLLAAGGYSAIFGGGEGDIKLVINKVGEITGINGAVVVFFAGLFLVVVFLFYALKAYEDAKAAKKAAARAAAAQDHPPEAERFMQAKKEFEAVTEKPDRVGFLDLVVHFYRVKRVEQPR